MKKAAIIGLGDIYPIHLSAIEKNHNITLCAVCDIDQAKRTLAPEGIPFYTDYKEMAIKEKPDCIHICLPHYLHYPVSKELVEMGFHVFCEKPVALNCEEAERFVQLEEAHKNIHIGICLQNRRNETVETLKAIIDSGDYGRVVGTRGIVPWYREESYYKQKPWRGKWETAGGGCMINQSIHTLDLLYYLGGEISGVKATVSKLLDYDIEVEDTVTAQLFYNNGAKGLFVATVANYKNESVQVTVQLEKGEFRIYDNVLYEVLEDGNLKKMIEDRKVSGTKFYYGASHEKIIGEFYEALEKEDNTYIKVSDAKMSIRLIDGIQKSGKTGQYVEI